MLGAVKVQNQEVRISRETLLKVLEKLLEKDPSDLETAVLFVAVRDGITIEEALQEIEKETRFLEPIKERLLEAKKSRERISLEDALKKLGLDSQSA